MKNPKEIDIKPKNKELNIKLKISLNLFFNEKLNIWSMKDEKVLKLPIKPNKNKINSSWFCEGFSRSKGENKPMMNEAIKFTIKTLFALFSFFDLTFSIIRNLIYAPIIEPKDMIQRFINW